MKIDFLCEKCGSNRYKLIQQQNQTGLYCADCNRWVKWVSKKEISDWAVGAVEFQQLSPIPAVHTNDTDIDVQIENLKKSIQSLQLLKQFLQERKALKQQEENNDDLPWYP